MAESPAVAAAGTSNNGGGVPLSALDTITEGVGVVVRVRPLSTKERADPSVHSCIQALSDIVVIDANAHQRSVRVEGRKSTSASAAAAAAPASQPVRSSTRPYQFSVDHVFHTHASQIEVYEASCKRVVEGVFHGINGSLLAYGATGSGKTHTMFGSTMSAAGIVYQAVQDIFAEKERLEEEEGKRVRVKCSFVEVYNEDVFDLLVRVDGGTKGSKRVPLQVRETGSADSGLQIPGLTHIFPETLEDFTRGVEHGHAQRFVAATGANAQSSRSHAIITVEVEVRGDPALAAAAAAAADGCEDDTRAGDIKPNGVSVARVKKPRAPTVTVASIQFGDLAGSERAAATSNTGLRLREGGNINRSLLALGAVVQSLAQLKVHRRQTGGAGGGRLFIPYRGSKLTRLLRDSIGGNCRTMMLFCVSPSTKHVEETVNTMKFAMNAREIQVLARRNEFAVNSSQLAKTQETVIEELRAELARTRADLALYTGDAAAGGGGGGGGMLLRGVTEVACGGEASATMTRENSAAPFARQASAVSISSPTATQASNTSATTANHSPSTAEEANVTTTAVVPSSSGAPSNTITAPLPRPSTPAPAVPPQRGTVTPSTSMAGGPAHAAVSPLSASAVAVSESSSLPRPSISSRAARPSVFADNTRLFSDLEARLKDFSAQKEGLYHAVRDAEERERDAEANLRELQWRLATFLVSDAYSRRARGEAAGALGPETSTIGVAGLRKTIAAAAEARAEQSAQLSDLTRRLEDADRQFAATRAALLRERQGTSLELLLDNARLRQGCTEAECLAAHYHQECRSLLSGEAEYAEALSKCVGALQRLRPMFTQLLHGSRTHTALGDVAAAAESAEVALLFAVLPTATTAQRMEAFETALQATTTTSTAAGPRIPMSSPEREGPSSPSTAFLHPPLAPSPTNRSGSGSSSPTRGGRSGSTPQSNQLAEQYRDLVATAELMHLGGGAAEAGSGGEGGGGGGGGVVVRPRHGRGLAPQGAPKATAASSAAAGAPRAFGRTVSLTGLVSSNKTTTITTTSTTTATATAANRNGKKAQRLALWPKNASHKHKQRGSGVSSSQQQQQPLQRSVSAPLPFQRSASAQAAGRGRGQTAAAAAAAKASVKNGGGNQKFGSPTAAFNDTGSPLSTPKKRSSKTATSLSHTRLSPKAMWSVPDTKPNFTRTHATKEITASPPQKQLQRSAGRDAAAKQSLATPPPSAKRTSAEDTPHSVANSSSTSSNNIKGRGGDRRAAGKTTSAAAPGKRAGGVPARNNGAAKAPPGTKGRRGSLAGAGVVSPGGPQRLTRSQTTATINSATAAAAGGSVRGERFAPTQLFPSAHRNREGSATTVTPLLSPRSSLGGEAVEASSLSRNGQPTMGTRTPTNNAPAADGITKAAKAGGTDGLQVPLTMSRLLERSATVPSLPHYGAIDANKENHHQQQQQQQPGFPSRPRSSLPDDLTVSRSTMLSDSPHNSRDFAAFDSC